MSKLLYSIDSRYEVFEYDEDHVMVTDQGKMIIICHCEDDPRELISLRNKSEC